MLKKQKKALSIIIGALLLIFMCMPVLTMKAEASSWPTISLSPSVDGMHVKQGETANIVFTIYPGTYSSINGYALYIMKGVTGRSYGAISSSSKTVTSVTEVTVPWRTNDYLPGTYTVIIYPTYGESSTPSYSNEVKATIYIDGDLETENATSEANAVDLRFNQTYARGWGSTDDDKACFNKISVPSTGILHLTLQKPYATDGSAQGFTYILYNKGNVDNPIVKTDLKSDKSDFKDSYDIYTGLKSGDYYLAIRPLYSISSGYIIAKYSADFEPTEFTEIEPNESASEATPLKLGYMYSGAFPDGPYGREDNFTFQGVSGHTIRIYFDNYSRLYEKSIIKFIKPSGDELWKYTQKSDERGDYYEYDLTESGTYRIRIYSGSGSVPILYKIGVYDTSGGSDPIEGAMYRLYNPNTGEHFYTGNWTEKNNLGSIGWRDEGVAWMSPSSSTTPVYRLYNPNSGEHHYTIDSNERNMLVSIGWKNEGIGWYSDDAKTTPLYRLYNPNARGAQEAGAHHYTKDINERNRLITYGWKDEGIGWYGQ